MAMEKSALKDTSGETHPLFVFPIDFVSLNRQTLLCMRELEVKSLQGISYWLMF